jgi:hypothetical protein
MLLSPVSMERLYAHMWERATLFWERTRVYVTFLSVRAVKPVCKSCRKVRIALCRGDPNWQL